MWARQKATDMLQAVVCVGNSLASCTHFINIFLYKVCVKESLLGQPVLHVAVVGLDQLVLVSLL